jgi:hypothetical protein
MFRLSLLMLLVVCAPCSGQAKKKAPPVKDQNHLVGVGDRYVLSVPIVVAKDRIEGIELAKSIEAKDKEGVAAMVDEKRAITFDAGLTIVVLELSTEAVFREANSHECRIIKDGKAVGKHPVHFSYFTMGQMKREPKP